MQRGELGDSQSLPPSTWPGTPGWSVSDVPWWEAGQGEAGLRGVEPLLGYTTVRATRPSDASV